jgi:acetyltransferase-like isoleucine patch superfamily enzyme
MNTLRLMRDRFIDRFYQWINLAEQRAIDAQKHALIAQFKQCGMGLKLNGSSHISGVGSIHIGQNVHIGDNAFIRGEGGLVIGDNTHISRNLVLYTVNHCYEGDRLPYDDTATYKPVEIGRNVWIGMNVCIVPGSKIGDGAIVGMGAVIAGEVPPLSIVGCQKFRILGYRDAEHYDALETQKRYGGVSGRELEEIQL